MPVNDGCAVSNTPAPFGIANFFLQTADKLPHLGAIIFIATVNIRRVIEHDQLRLDLANHFTNTVKQPCRFNDPAAIRHGHQRFVFRNQRQDMQPCSNLAVGRAVVLQDQIEPPPNFFLVVFTANADDGTGIGRAAQPVFAENDSDGELQRQNTFADTALAAQQRDVLRWYAISDDPLTFRNSPILPTRNIAK
jgi:hypothetical protein